MIFKPCVDKNKYFIATYDVKSTTSLRDAAWNIAIGQSVGNPNVRNDWETDELFENHSCKILHCEEDLSKLKNGLIEIAFPVANTDWKGDGVSQLLCQLMGGQLDIDIITKCRLVNLWFPETVKCHFLGPKFGLTGARKFTKTFDKPLLGAIIKPKTGITPQVLLEMTKELVEGGVNFIKEDEIMANPPCCPLEERVPLISEYIKDKNVIFAFCINGDSPHVLERVKMVHRLGGNAVHINFWCGMGVYKSVRELDLPIFVHFQKSGDQILTNEDHKFGIDANVFYQIAAMSGVDTLHAGMIGGYSNSNPFTLRKTLKTLAEYDVVPALSCGMHPGLVDYVRSQVGDGWMANCGGSVHGHPKGTRCGVNAMRQAIDRNHNEEYNQAIAKWGYRSASKLHVIIPAAGAGSRFTNYGFKTPKFLLPMDTKGTPMLYEAIKTLNAPHNTQYTIVCNEKDLERIKPTLVDFNPLYLTVDYLTRGAAETALLGLPEDPCVPIICSNSDQVMELWETNDFVEKCGDCDGGVLTYRPPYPLEIGAKDKHSFAKIDSQWLCTEIEEKKILSHHALVGVHYFRNREVFQTAYDEMVANHKQEGEFYVSELYSAMLRLGMKVKAVPLESTQRFIPVGIPNDYFRHVNPKIGPVDGDCKVVCYDKCNHLVFPKFVCNLPWLQVKVVNQVKDQCFDLAVLDDGLITSNPDKVQEKSAVLISNDQLTITEDHQLSEMTRGWFIGNFTPSVHKTKEFEIGILTHHANEVWDFHIHREMDEYNYILSGRMLLNGIEYCSGNAFVLPRGHLAAPKFLETCKIVCVKTPSCPVDKVIV